MRSKFWTRRITRGIRLQVTPGATGTEREEILDGEHPLSVTFFVFCSLWPTGFQYVAAANLWTIPQTVPDPPQALETSLQKSYGFLNAYTGYFLHRGNTENGINELDVDAETLSPSEVAPSALHPPVYG